MPIDAIKTNNQIEESNSNFLDFNNDSRVSQNDAFLQMLQTSDHSNFTTDTARKHSKQEPLKSTDQKFELPPKPDSAHLRSRNLSSPSRTSKKTNIDNKYTDSAHVQRSKPHDHERTKEHNIDNNFDNVSKKNESNPNRDEYKSQQNPTKNNDLKTLKLLASTVKDCPELNDLLSFFRGHSLEKTDDAELGLLKNKFIGRALEGDVNDFMESEFTISELCGLLGIDHQSLNSLSTQDLNLDQKITPKDLLVSIGISPKSVTSRLNSLKQSLVDRHHFINSFPQAQPIKKTSEIQAQLSQIPIENEFSLDGGLKNLSLHDLEGLKGAEQKQILQSNAKPTDELTLTYQSQNNSSNNLFMVDPTSDFEVQKIYNLINLKSDAEEQVGPSPDTKIALSLESNNFSQQIQTDSEYKQSTLSLLNLDQNNPVITNNQTLQNNDLQSHNSIESSFLQASDNNPFINVDQSTLNHNIELAQNNNHSIESPNITNDTHTVNESNQLAAMQSLLNKESHQKDESNNRGRKNLEIEQISLNSLPKAAGEPKFTNQSPHVSQPRAQLSVEGRQELVDKIQEQTNLLASKNGGRASISIQDKNLGDIFMAVQVEGRNVKLQLQSPSEQIRNLLGNDLVNLKDSLSTQDLNLVNVDVSDNDRSNEGYTQHNFDQQMSQNPHYQNKKPTGKYSPYANNSLANNISIDSMNIASAQDHRMYQNPLSQHIQVRA